MLYGMRHESCPLPAWLIFDVGQYFAHPTMHIISQVQDRLKHLLPAAAWNVSNGTRTIRAEYVPASKAIAASASIDVVAQFWMMSPFRWLTFELAGDSEDKIAREQLADDIRRYFGTTAVPGSVVFSNGSTVCRFRVDPENRDPTQILSDLDDFVSFVRDRITGWTASKLAA